jgi:hypothetical protein
VRTNCQGIYAYALPESQSAATAKIKLQMHADKEKQLANSSWQLAKTKSLKHRGSGVSGGIAKERAYFLRVSVPPW